MKRCLVLVFGFWASVACSGTDGGTDTLEQDPVAITETKCDVSSSELHECVTASGKSGVAICEVDGTLSDCGVVSGCMPNSSASCFAEGSPMRQQFGDIKTHCRVIDSEWRSGIGDCSTPLVLAFDDQPVTFTEARGHFDLNGGLTQTNTDWVSAKTPWLVLDRNQNGNIDDGRELFGSMTRLADGSRAQNGFSALAALDDNHDGWINASDTHFGQLLLWSDTNQDRQSASHELKSAESAGLVALELAYTVKPRCQEFACEVERAHMLYRDNAGNVSTGAVIDVHFVRR
jgi:hypothetical protein